MFQLSSNPRGLAGILDSIPREALFSLTDKVTDPETGETTDKVSEYTVPVEFPPTAAMLYANVLANSGAEYATTWAMQIALGVDGFNALCGADVSREDFVKIVAIVVGKIQGLAVSIPGASDPKETAPAA